LISSWVNKKSKPKIQKNSTHYYLKNLSNFFTFQENENQNFSIFKKLGSILNFWHSMSCFGKYYFAQKCHKILRFCKTTILRKRRFFLMYQILSFVHSVKLPVDEIDNFSVWWNLSNFKFIFFVIFKNSRFYKNQKI